MIKLLRKIFIKEDNLSQEEIRGKNGMLCSIVGIVLNIFLFAGKFIAGTIANSIAITADAFNNLSDAGSSLITLCGFKLAAKKPDPTHPFGHGRIEYISGLVVSGIILIMAFELLTGSIDKIRNPEPADYSILALAILAISVLIKLYMYYYNHTVGKEMKSAAMLATATDSLGDSIATTVVFIAALVGKFTGLELDGYLGLLVSLFIFYAGIGAAKETIDPLLGQPPEAEFIAKIEEIAMAHDDIIGIHDLVVHDYGPGRVMVTFHAEVPAEGDILELHDTVDVVENELREALNCHSCIHMDPVETTNELVISTREKIVNLLKEIDPIITMHDFRMVPGSTHTNVIFDVLIPFKYKMTDEELVRLIQNKVWTDIADNYMTVIEVDKDYNKVL